MSSINALKKRMSQLDAEKAALARVSVTARKIQMPVNIPLAARY
jgi:hypothetical protein